MLYVYFDVFLLLACAALAEDASSLDDTGRQITHNDFQFPQEANLFAGGTLGEHISFLGEVTLAAPEQGHAPVRRRHLGR